MNRALFALPIAFLGLMALSTVRADGECRRSCGEQLSCEVEVVDCLIASGRTREAIERLKPLVKAHPERPAYARLLASAYLADGNAFWAQRTLQAAIDADPADCESRSWLVWVHLKQGDLESARERLGQAGCPRTAEDRGRWQVLEAFVARTGQERSVAASHVDALGRSERLYPEDERAWHQLRAQQDPGWIEPLSLRAEILAGYTSDGRGGSPADVTSGDEDSAGSALGRFDLFGRLVLPVDRTVRPALEGGIKGHGLAASGARNLSYLDFSARPGLIVGSAFPRLFAGYKANLLLMGLKDKELYYEAHRGELELETGIGVLLFAGAGRRIFREAGRTRTELDGGVGGSFSPVRRLHLVAALSLRYYLAVGEAYDQFGGSALLATRLDLGRGFYGRLGVTPGFDAYPGSGGETGLDAFGSEQKRSDWLVKLFAEGWSPPWNGVRLGLRYEYAWRDSTADEPSSDYDYQEHRLLAGLRFKTDLDPGAPGVVSGGEHVELDYGLGDRADGAGEEERIQELLRQDEAARAGSSCVE